MTPIAEAHAPATAGRVRLGAPCALALVVAGGLAAGAAATGLVPDGATAQLWWGTGIAAVTSLIGIAVLARCTTARSDDPNELARLYVSGLAANLGLQAVAVVSGVVAFSLQGEKFVGLAAFGLSFAVTATLVQVAGALSISRFLQGRARRDRPDSSERSFPR